ncbi:hypothetical protein FKM82_016232 [Ascaphus truei]
MREIKIHQYLRISNLLSLCVLDYCCKNEVSIGNRHNRHKISSAGGKGGSWNDCEIWGFSTSQHKFIFKSRKGTLNMHGKI